MAITQKIARHIFHCLQTQKHSKCMVLLGGKKTRNQRTGGLELRFWYHNCDFFHYVLTKVHITYLGLKFVEITFKFNVVLPNTLTRKRRSMHWIPKARWMVRVFVPNFKVLYYFMEWVRILRRRRLCVMCEKKFELVFSTCDNTMVSFGLLCEIT